MNSDSSIAHCIICTQLFRGKMSSDCFNGIKILQDRWQHWEKVGYCYPSGLEKTLCKWDIYVPLVTKGLNTGTLSYSIYNKIKERLTTTLRSLLHKQVVFLQLLKPDVFSINTDWSQPRLIFTRFDGREGADALLLCVLSTTLYGVWGDDGWLVQMGRRPFSTSPEALP